MDIGQWLGLVSTAGGEGTSPQLGSSLGLLRRHRSMGPHPRLGLMYALRESVEETWEPGPARVTLLRQKSDP